MRKAYTEDEKTEIAQLYRDGRPVNEIASKFGRKPDSIYKLLSSMGVKRRKYEKPEVIAGSDASDPPKAKRECTLKKPWYLQRQTPNNRTKQNMSKVKLFRFVAPGVDEQVYYQTTRAAINDAVVASFAGHTKLYRVLEDGSEMLLYDSLKCKEKTTDAILKWAEKGGRT